MKIFTDAEINQTRQHFREQGCQELEARFTPEDLERARVHLLKRRFQKLPRYLKDHPNGLVIPYFRLPQELNPSLPDFVFRCTGTNRDNAVFGISDSHPQEFERYPLAHEYFEYLVIPTQREDRCLMASRLEIALVPLDRLPPYLQRRETFFETLIASNYQHINDLDEQLKTLATERKNLFHDPFGLAANVERWISLFDRFKEIMDANQQYHFSSQAFTFAIARNQRSIAGFHSSSEP